MSLFKTKITQKRFVQTRAFPTEGVYFSSPMGKK